tara:strand:+ start:652 stop:1104 length:453 start_codon:yes stop_codon:yes gene_type:complete
MKLIIIIFLIINNDKVYINKVLDDLHLFASQAKGKEYFKLFDDDAIFFGTDANERWTKLKFEEYAMERFKTGSGWTYNSISRNIYLDNDKNTAWFDEELNNEKYGVFRGTGVLVKSNNIWKIKQYNLLLPIPNDLLIEYSKEIKLFLKNE